MYTVGQSISLCPLLVSGVAQLFRSPLPDVQLAFHRVPLRRSPGSGQKVTCFQRVVAGIAVIVVHLISPRYSSWSLSENHCGVQEETEVGILYLRGCSA